MAGFVNNSSTQKSPGLSADAQTGIMQPGPLPRSFWRHPRRFLQSRFKMMFGKPLSVRWGLDRGLPAHRHYINSFMQEHASDIHGVCLEFDDRDYMRRFGGEKVTVLDVLHLDESNPRATVIADITKPNSILSDHYDCVICTHVLHVIYDFDAAIAGMHRILKPGGVLLIASPLTSMCDEREGELWRFTRLGLFKMLARSFGEENVISKAYGNSLVSAGELRGMIADEFTQKELNFHDTRSALEICARAVKA